MNKDDKKSQRCTMGQPGACGLFFRKIIVALSFLFIFFYFYSITFAAYTSDSLVLSLNLDENSGITAADSSGNSNNGTVSGSPTWSGGSMSFDGSDDKISVPHSASLNSSSHSYEVWYTMPSSGTWSAMSASLPRLIDKIPNTNASSTNILIDKTTRKVWVFFASSTWSGVTLGTTNTNSLIGSTALNYSTDYQITFAYNNTSKVGQIYINGVLDAQGTTSGNYIPSTSSLSIGGRPDDNLRNTVGTIHRISMYSKALTSSEISSNYAEGKNYNYSTSPDPTVVSASESTVTASTNSVVSNGVASTTITVTAKNYLGEPLSGKTVSLTSNRGGIDSISPASVATNASGIATFIVSSNTTGSSNLTVVADGVTLNTAQTISFVDQYVTTTGVTYTSTLDSLSLKMDVAYDRLLDNAPIVIDLHGYSGPYTGTDIIQRLARKGVFAIKTYKRGYGSSQGVQDDSGREVHDFYDAIEYVKNNYSAYVDTDNINVIGYSGGGGNTYGLITKFPDYFRSANIFFGMSDYCYDPTYSWWYNGDSSYRTGMQTHIGGTPVTAADKCYARAHHIGAKNNPYSHIQLFYDTAETVVPLSHATQYSSQNTVAGFSNVTTRISDSSSTTNEFSDTFATNLADYSFIGNGQTAFMWDNAGYIEWSGDRTLTFSSIYKKFTSLRNYGKADRIKASFNTTISSASTNGAIFFGFRNSNDSSLKNTVSIVVVDNVPSVRIDYNGTFSTTTTTNRDFTSFTTTLSTGTTYGFDLEINNSVVTATLKNALGATLETKTVNFNVAKGFDGVDSFGIYNFAANDFSDILIGTFDNLVIDAYARWVHGYPQEGTGTAEGNITAENYFVPDMVAGTWSQPVLNTTGTMFIPGWVKTKKFQVFLGDGNDEAGNLTYDISGSANSISSPKTLTVEGLTGTSNITLKIYDLTPNTEYNIRDSNLTEGGDTTTQATTDSSGTLSFSGILGSTHQYDIFSGSVDATPPILYSISADRISTAEASITWSTDEVATSQVEYGLSSSYTASTTLNSALVTTHQVPLQGLLAGTIYHYRVISKDALNNTSTSTDRTFITISQPSAGGGRGGLSGGSVVYVPNSVALSEVPKCVSGLNCMTVTSSMVNVPTFTRDLGFRAQGDDVRALQQFLISKNFLEAGNDTGYFGPLTHQSLIRYQKAIGIMPASGYFGSVTRSKMMVTTEILPHSQISQPFGLQNDFTKDLKIGAVDHEVRLLQRFLNSKGFTVSGSGAGSPGLETVYFGPATQAALIRFQLASGISPAAGYFGPKTREYLGAQ